MKTEHAIQRAGSAKALAELLGITVSAISQWGEDIPQTREWQLRVLRPEWFSPPDRPSKKQPLAARRSHEERPTA